MTDLHLEPEFRSRSTVVTAGGALTPATASRLRDGVLKFATDAPDCVVVDIRDLTVEHERLLSVFAVIAARIDDWPGVSFALVADRPEHVAGLRARSIGEFVAVHPDVVTAEQARDEAPRRRAVRELAPTVSASALARRFVAETCTRWAVPEYTEDAQLIATELVENTVEHTTSPARVRLELRRALMRVAVADDDPRPAVRRERLTPVEPGLGLQLVAQTARTWGCSRSWLGGKVVWAVLRSPDPSTKGSHGQ
ncbi:ATP-binding protein [Amycolatopsis solani]|uniref:ATP-binding protein n=1 Tax=Amycolatopsis solani TaxID=3028615 RepID=UPI0025AF2CEF|nr:ATP-binding protein [Amycolatopsis sp. MEP2-6]